MEKKHILAFIFLVFTGLLCHAQGFDDLKKAKPVVYNKKLQALVDKNDVKGLEKLLSSKPETINDGSNYGNNDRGATLTIPLFYDVVDRTLLGTASLDLCHVCLAAGCDVYTIYNGKTPIYRVMDFFATTPSDKCEIGMEVLKLLVAQKGFDLNRRYRSLPPPFSYLLSENFKFLGNKYSKDYLSTELVRFLLDNGAYLNTYDENGASLLLFADQTNNEFLRDYLLENGVNINRAADAEGNNAVYAAIADNNVPLLQKIVNNYNVRLTTPMVKDWTSRVSPYMFEYLIGQCADNAYTYDEVVEFRTFFPNMKEMVQKRYEELAQYETNNANDFDAIRNVRIRYPDLEKITGPRRLSIYREHAARVESLYKAALSAAKRDDPKHQGNSKCLTEFIQNYNQKSFFDPDQKVRLAKVTAGFYVVCAGLNMYVRERYIEKEYMITAILLDRPYAFMSKWASEDTAKVNSAIRVIQNNTDTLFQPFYDKNYETLVNKQSQLYTNINKSIEIYNKAIVEARSNSSSYSSSSSSSNYSSSSSSSVSQNSSSSNQDNSSCKVHLYFKDGKDLFEGRITVYFKGLFNTASKSFTTDQKGNVTLTWSSDSQGEIIKTIAVDRNIGFNDAYSVGDLELKNGGNYNICIDCK